MFAVVFFGAGLWACCSAAAAQNSTAANGGAQTAPSQQTGQQANQQAASWKPWAGLPVRRIVFEGVSQERLATLSAKLPQAIGQPLDEAKVAESLRQVFATGLFEEIEVAATREGDGVTLIFRGTARTFIGTVIVDGAKGATRKPACSTPWN
jgi:outer membrane protein assembly factor BamA